MLRLVKVLCLSLLLIGVGGIAAAESHEEASMDAPMYVWVNFVKAKPGQGDALIGHMIQEGTKMYDPLIESGAVLDWGVAMPIVHDGNDPYSHVEWVTFIGWKGADSFMDAFMASRQEMSPEEMKASGEKWGSLVEPGSHADNINRVVDLGTPGDGRIAYIHLSYVKAKFGKSGALMKMWNGHAKPVYSQLNADGKIVNFGLHVPAVARDNSWSHMGWYASEGLAARDVVEAAFRAAEAEWTEEQAKEWQNSIMENLEPDFEHQILMVVHHKMGGGGESE